METSSLDETSKSSRDNSIKDLGTSHSSLKSTKSLDNKSNSTSGSLKREKNTTIQFKTDSLQEIDNQKLHPDAPLKVPHKFIANWRQACDRTKDKTKDLLKRWRTLPEIEVEGGPKKTDSVDKSEGQTESGWSVHVWSSKEPNSTGNLPYQVMRNECQEVYFESSDNEEPLTTVNSVDWKDPEATWVDRFSIESEFEPEKDSYMLTPIQKIKLSHFFTCLLDHDQDNLICEQDFESLIERLRHFIDWSVNSPEFNILREVERGFIVTFLCGIGDEKFGFTVNDVSYLTKEGWFHKWAELISGSKNLIDFPIWLQFFVKVLFQVINRSGTGIITRDELSSFYSSVLCLDTLKVGEILDLAYRAMTSNGDHALHFRSFRLCFSNYLLGRYPNGSGQYILGTPPSEMSAAMFPIDYSALNAQPEDLEQYAPDQKSNRRSVIV